MTPEQFQRARALFERVCDASPAERARILDAECDDGAMRTVIEGWIAEDARAQPLDAGLDLPAALAGLTPASITNRDADAEDPGEADRDGARFMPGTLLADRYRVISLLGRGGMGEVYRADDLKLGQPVALKFLPRGLERDHALLQRLLKEVRTARQVTHVNVCRVYDIGEIDGQHFLSMEYVDGENLASLLRRIGRLPQDKAVQVAREVAAGLHAAHEQGILHRDLKPANIMLDGRGRVKITDFGLADLEQAIRETDIRSGTPEYMAPEQLAGEAVTVRSEVFALGLVLYELFTGASAFEGTSVQDAAERRAGRTPPAPSHRIEGLDPRIEKTILRCLDPDPLARPAAVDDVASALPACDALRAVLHEGETPSPDVVAAAGGTGLVPKPVLVGLFGAALAGIIGMALLADHVWLLPRLDLRKTPAQLTGETADILADLRDGGVLAPADPGRDMAFGLAPDSGRLAKTRRDAAFAARHPLGADRPAAVTFWYRESPSGLYPYTLSAQYSPVTASNPDPYRPGMVNVRLDMEGRLLRLTSIPPVGSRSAEVDIAPGAEIEPDWRLLFEKAQLPFAEFTEVAEGSDWTPPMFADRRRTWTGTIAEDIDITVEAASLRSQVVAFVVRMPWDRLSRGAPGVHVPTIGRAVFLVFASLLAWRNFRRRRGDLRGAFIIGVCSMILGVAFWTISPSRLPRGGSGIEYALEGSIARSLFWSASTALMYFALEPYIRRRVPERMIAWSRLISGRWRDPLVGRDVLIGIAAGLGSTAAVTAIDVWARDILEAPERVVGQWTFLAGGLRHSVGGAFAIMGQSFGDTITALTAVLIVKIVTRNIWVAAALLCVFMTWVQAAGNPNLPLAVFAVPRAIFWFVLLRFGLIAGWTATIASFTVTTWPGATDITAWYGYPGTTALVLILVLATYGFRIALAGRPLVSDRVLES